MQMTPNSSIHILAKSDENVPANSQTGVHSDWVDLKEKSAEEPINPIKEKPSLPQADKVQHEVAALKMAQGLLKGTTYTSALRFWIWQLTPPSSHLDHPVTMQLHAWSSSACHSASRHHAICIPQPYTAKLYMFYLCCMLCLFLRPSTSCKSRSVEHGWHASTSKV